jgi:hypothetical protein
MGMTYWVASWCGTKLLLSKTCYLHAAWIVGISMSALTLLWWEIIFSFLVSTAVTYDKSIKAIRVKVPDSDEEFLLHPATVRRNDRSAQSVVWRISFGKLIYPFLMFLIKVITSMWWKIKTTFLHMLLVVRPWTSIWPDTKYKTVIAIAFLLEQLKLLDSIVI